MKDYKNENQITIKPYTQKELAGIYGVSAKTFRKWIKALSSEIGEVIGYYYSIVQVKIIFSRLQLPTTVSIVNEDEYKLYDRNPSKKIEGD